MRHPRRPPVANAIAIATVAASLLVAAEGRNSPTRAAAGIATAHWRYDHAAIIGAFHHERSHENVAYEIFYPSGPFALLPLVDDADGHRCAIVGTPLARELVKRCALLFVPNHWINRSCSL